MARTIKCPNCKKPLQIREEQFEQKLVCPSCGSSFRVKSPAQQVSGKAYKKPPEQPRPQPAPLPLGDERDGTMLGQMLPPPPPLPSAARNGRPPLDPRRSSAQAPPLRRSSSPPPPAKSGGRKILIALLILVLLGGAGVGGWFGYQHWFAKKPEEAKSNKFGGIEIGSSGVKMVAVEMKTTDDGVTYNVMEMASIDTNLAVLDEKTNNFADANLRTTLSNVRIYYDELIKAGVPKENIHIMCSSGILSRVKDPAAVERNMRVLKEEVKGKVEKDLEEVEASEESRFTVIAIVPKKDWQGTLAIDIGSGNTKGGGLEGKGFIDFQLKFGAKSLAGEINKQKYGGESFQAALNRLTPTLIAQPLRQEFDRTRVLQSRKSVQLLGGIVWAMATYTHPEKQLENRSELSAADIREFQGMLLNQDPEARKRLVLGKLQSSDPAIVAQVEKDVGAIHKIFKYEELLAGAQILSVVEQEAQLAGKKVEFFRKGQYAWLLGHVLDKSGQLK